MRLDMSLLYLRNLIFYLEDLICLLESFLNITNIDPDLCCQIFR